MSKVCLLVLLLFASGCMHWAPISSIEDAAGACHVRVVADERPPVVLERPSVEEVRALVMSSEHARVEVRKMKAWATALIVTGSVIWSLFVAAPFLGAAAAGIAGG